MVSIDALVEQVPADLAGVFTDIDDTLTTDGALPARVYTALERLHDAGLAVVPVTGRPAGWCDMVARFWPVDGVVGENGAFAFSYDRLRRRMTRTYAVDSAIRSANRRRLDALATEIVAALPACAVASDQPYREADLAIDVAEDVERLTTDEVAAIVAMFERAGATAKVSSIHVNGWFGAYDKLGMTRRFAREVLGYDLERENERFVFVGDSPNDEPMFAFFRLACGVGSVRSFAHRLEHLPRFVTRASGGDGFLEVANAIERALGARSA